MVIAAVTLVMDSLPNIQRFVTANVAAGMNHLVVVLDDAAQDAAAYLGQHPRVTLVVADNAWWDGERPPSLNGRQRAAANLAREACASVGFVDWLFFVDGDEVALPDLGLLRGLPPEVSAVRLLPLESVSGGEDTLFKRLLTPPELRQLKRAGLIDRANNANYFHGHVSGKVGVRPSADLSIAVHSAEDRNGDKVPAFEHPLLRHLHFESPTFDEFVRKWTVLAASGPPPGMRDRRAAVLNGFVEIAHQRDPVERDRVARQLYERYVAEDAAGLEAAGVLESIDVTALPTESEPLSRPQVARLEAEILRHSLRPKTDFLPRRSRL